VQNVEKYRDRFGCEFIIFPNPLYGGWEKPFRGESPETTVRNKKDALREYRP